MESALSRPICNIYITVLNLYILNRQNVCFAEMAEEDTEVNTTFDLAKDFGHCRKKIIL